jgi:hypothetical protein
LAFSAGEGLWAQDVNYGLTYTITLDSAQMKLKPGKARRLAWFKAVAASGLFEAPVRTTWADWHNSLKGDALSTRGYAQLGWDSADDKLVNVCVQNPGGFNLKPIKNPGDRVLRPSAIPGIRVLSDNEIDPEDAFLPDKNLTPENSWMSYDLSLAIKPIDDVARFKLLPEEDVEALYKPRERSLHEPGPHPEDYAQGKSPSHAFQFRAQPSFEVVLEGTALRANYHVGRPTLVTVGGQKAYPIRTREDYFEQKVFGNLLTPLVAARWRLTYALAGVPRAVGAPDHPVHGNAEGAGRTLTGFTALS